MIPRVCHLVISLQPGGLEQLVVNWTNARNARQAASTTICVLDEDGPLAEHVHGECVVSLRARRRRFPWDRKAVARLRALLANYDVVHSHNLAAQQYAALACGGLKTLHVHTEHGSNPHTGGWLNRSRLRFVGRQTDVLVCVSHDTAARMTPCWRVPPERVETILNGVSPHRPLTGPEQSVLAEDIGVADSAFVIGSIGRLSIEKRYDRLIQSLAGLRRRWPDLNAKLVLVGEGDERGPLELLAKSLALGDNVVFCGYRPDSRSFLDVFDVFAMSSETEGLPVALLEAMAAACPVAVTDAGDCLRVIEEGRAGIALPRDDSSWPERFAAMATEERETLRRLSAHALNRVETHYSEARTLEAYETHYTGHTS